LLPLLRHVLLPPSSFGNAQRSQRYTYLILSSIMFGSPFDWSLWLLRLVAQSILRWRAPSLWNPLI
jgi:hypothetical protein